MKQTSPGK